MTTMTNEAIQVGAITVRFRVEAEQSGGSVTVFEFDVPAATNLPAAHSHDGYEETIYGLEGVLSWTVDGRQVEVGPGDVLVIPRGAVHQFANPLRHRRAIAGDRHARHPRPGVLPRGGRDLGRGGCGRRAAGLRRPRRGDAPARPHLRRLTRAETGRGGPLRAAAPVTMPQPRGGSVASRDHISRSSRIPGFT